MNNKHILKLTTHLGRKDLVDKLRTFEPWGHRIDFSNGVSTSELVRRTPFAENTLQKFNIVVNNLPMENLEGGNLLDVGCNSGYNSIYAATNFKMQSTGIDVVKRHISVSKLLSNIAQVDAKFLMASAETFSRHDFYDLICHFGTLYHLKNPILSLENSYKNLKKGGFIAIETQIYDHPDDEYICYFMHMQNNDPTNFWALSMKTLNSSLQLIGFDQVRLLKRTTPALMAEYMHRVILIAKKE